MKVNIWIKKEDVLSGNITEYYTQVKNLGYEDYVQVSVTTDELAQLEDSNKLKITYPEFVEKHYTKVPKDTDSDDWLVAQYNRNREQKDWVTSKKDIPYIYERNPDTGAVYRRHSGDKHENRERVSMGVAERDYSGEKGLDQLKKEMLTKTGAEFLPWFNKLTKHEQTTLSTFYND